jgi:outer membrane murein-binding lipoprotein Lpp
MTRFHFGAAVLCTLWLSGCVSHPQTAEEFRKAVPGAFSAKVETFEVDHPFSQVASTFQRMGPNCLSKTIKTTSQTTTSYQVIVTTYKPTVVVTGTKAELHVQQHHEQGVINVSKEPAGGYYVLVADALPLTPTKTRIDLYRPSIGHSILIQAVKNWATGENVGCPDLTK